MLNPKVAKTKKAMFGPLKALIEEKKATMALLA
jgi:hypothetical protein